MVHRGFTEHSRTARNYSEEMAPVNGIRDASSFRLFRNSWLFRDEVSKRMGELLLRGVTMLDAYCQVCNGILMEDRNGVRTCVTCELFAERTREGSRLIAEVPLGWFFGQLVRPLYLSAKDCLPRPRVAPGFFYRLPYGVFLFFCTGPSWRLQSLE
ncbi:unnamed protein product [Heligmosomoides polygyrus]|uniref:OrfB_Zn_ribbon domain-containing protein n=1 Tax=Heligmosomoides polygyrus TaxID=6339 RepID=A0A183FT46_HELPZ|nr:unnamed protein product [Heligmosomoides polygyrus]